MSGDEADELLKNNDWATWSDARYLLQTAADIGAKDTAGLIAVWLESSGQYDLAKTVRKRWG
jgi:hypothetical protein